MSTDLEVAGWRHRVVFCLTDPIRRAPAAEDADEEIETSERWRLSEVPTGYYTEEELTPLREAQAAIDEARAERDRFKEELVERRDALVNLKGRAEALASENAGLRGSLESALREANEASNGADQCAVIALGIEAALASTSPLTSAVERALEAHSQWCSLYRHDPMGVVPPRWDECIVEMLDAHENLRALLKGRS